MYLSPELPTSTVGYSIRIADGLDKLATIELDQ
jgi:hypothetical protein